MGEPLADFSAQGVCSRSCLCHSTYTYRTPGCERSCDSCTDEAFEAEISCGQDAYAVEEIGTALAEGMNVYDHGGPDLDDDTDENEDAVLSLESDSTDDLVDDDTDVVISSAFTCDDAIESSIDKSGYDPSTNGTPLVSAMKGTRAKQGIITKLSVSWAPDVYDPPITSDSHTVKGYHRSSRKSYYKYKPSKSSSSSSRSANSSKRDKKHSRHSSSSSSNKKDKKHSYRSSSSLISRTESSIPQYYKAYSGDSSRTDSHSIESAKAIPLVPPGSAAIPEVVPVLRTVEQIKCPTSFKEEPSAAMPEAVPVLKTIEQIKCATSCKEKPFNLLSRQFSPARYKGMFSFWSQNQLAS